jgi:hypothetical protein
MPHRPWTLVGQHASVRFSVTADCEPGLLPRLLQPFAKRDLTPDVFECRRSGETLRVDIAMHAMPAEMVHLVEGNLAQTIGVRSVTRQTEITGVVRRQAA